MAKKGYWMGHVEVHDPERYKLYIKGATPAYEEYGAKFLVRGGTSETPEGEGYSRNVIIEFETYQQALACYNSPDYVAAREHRIAASNGQITIVEGHEG